MITGAHSIIYSTSAEKDRAFFRDVLGLPSVDVGGGWLIFGLPPAEIAFHPSDENDVHEFYLICDDIDAFVRAMNERDINCGPIEEPGWGLLTQITLPGGGKLGVYQPRHARPKAPGVPRPARKPSRTRAAAKTAKKRGAGGEKKKKKARRR